MPCTLMRLQWNLFEFQLLQCEILENRNSWNQVLPGETSILWIIYYSVKFIQISEVLLDMMSSRRILDSKINWKE